MYSTTETIFFFWKNFVQIILIMILILSISNILLDKKYKLTHLRISTFGLIVSFIQFIMSLIFGFLKINRNFDLLKNIMLSFLAVVFIFIGWSIHTRQNNSRKKHFRIFIFFFIGLLFIFFGD